MLLNGLENCRKRFDNFSRQCKKSSIPSRQPLHGSLMNMLGRSQSGYSMLVRHIQMSGGKIYGNKRIHGRKELRDVFLGAAESGLRTDTSLRDYYEALRARGTDHKDAKIALARKIAATCLCLLKNNDTFKNDYDVQQIEREKLRKELNLKHV
ncbi:MAG: hypothetical protein ACHQHP_06855 [Bacteroidia bacterium]